MIACEKKKGGKGGESTTKKIRGAEGVEKDKRGYGKGGNWGGGEREGTGGKR